METSRRSLSVFPFFAIVMVSLIIRCRGEELGRASVLPPSQTNNNITIPPTASVKRDPQVSITELMKEQRNKDFNNVQVRKGNRKNGGGGGGGGGWRWGNGGGGGGGGGGGSSSSSSGGSIGGGGGWGWGGGGGGWWGWGCMSPKRNHRDNGDGGGGGGGDRQKKRRFSNKDYRIGEFAECMVGGRCQGMRLDCPLHCGGPCFYDCKNMCKAHCRRP